MAIKDILPKLLKQKRISQTKLAEAIGATQQQVSEWARGEVVPGMVYVEKMAARLGVSVGHLMGKEEQPGILSPEDRLFLEFVREIGHSKAMRVIARAFAEASDSPSQEFGREPHQNETRRAGKIPPAAS